jgi:hypothetical protein
VNAERGSHPLFVPVRASQSGTLALQTGRLASGQPVGLAFTSAASLLSAMGPSQRWTRICEAPLRDMLAPLGVNHIRVDPRLVSDLAGGAPASTVRKDTEQAHAEVSGTTHPARRRHRAQQDRRAA